MRAAGTGRSHRLAVTDAGIALYDRAMRRVVALNVELAHAMSTDERCVLDDILQRLQVRVAALADAGAKTAPPATQHLGRR